MDKKYVLDESKTAILDINAFEFIDDNTIVFPAEIDGNKITSINISTTTLKDIKRLFKKFDVIIEDGITDIKEYMFQFSSNLNTVSIPPSIETIPTGCFCDSSVKEIIFQEGCSLKSICNGAFFGCTKLKAISLPKTLKSIGINAFRNSGLTELSFPKVDGKLDLGDFSFAECHHLKKVTFPEMELCFGKRAFYLCDKLTTVEMSKLKIETIPSGFFYYCNSLKNAILPKTITTIGEGAFYNCVDLPTVGLVNTNTFFIMPSAFENCSSYKDGNFPPTLQIIDNSAFSKCAIDSLSLPLSTLRRIGDYAFSANPLSEGLSMLPFIDCESIGDNVFSGCGIKHIQLLPLKGKNVSGGWMFEGCSSLEEVKMEDYAQLFIGMFNNCFVLKTVDLPHTLTAIPSFTFAKCELNEVEFPESIAEIGESAFMGADLKKVDLSKSKSIFIDVNAFINTPIESVRFPTYDCTIINEAFDVGVLNNIIEEYPFITIEKEPVPF